MGEGYPYQTEVKHNLTVADVRERVDELVELIEEYGLDSAELSGSGWRVRMSKATKTAPVTAYSEEEAAAPMEVASTGTAVTSPTTGIFYSSPNPGSPAYIKVGEAVVAGQVIGLIEAMKVFNEITATISGTVSKIAADNGQLVQPGDPLVYIG